MLVSPAGGPAYPSEVESAQGREVAENMRQVAGQRVPGQVQAGEAGEACQLQRKGVIDGALPQPVVRQVQRAEGRETAQRPRYLLHTHRLPEPAS